MTQAAPENTETTDPTEAEPTSQVEPGETDPTEDPNDPDPRVQRANRQAAQYRTQLRETQQQLQQLTQAQTENAGVLDALRKALTGDTGEGETDPAEVARQATEQVTGLQTENASLRAQLLVHELSGDLNGNANALLDSRSFLNSLDALDAASEDYRDQVAEAIKTAVSKNTTLRAGQVQRRGGSENAGGAGDSGTVTQDQFDAMNIHQRTELFQTNPTLYRKLAGN